ncbi:MAG: S-adenosylmethionine decarboxylase, partial [Lentisphaeria bacterium]|nr:S-adenosylmethionine decarboxylase [Lentisphaeria bacterium]
VSGVVVISESHFAVHAWPEYGYAAVDLFTCGENIDFDTAVEEIKNGMQSKSWIVSSLVSRGILNGAGVERIRPIREDDDCHAFQLSWRSRFNDTNARAFSNSIDLYGCELQSVEEIRQAVGCFCSGLVDVISSQVSGKLDIEVTESSLDFFQRYRCGSLSGNIKLDGSVACIDIRIDGFFDPHAASELAMRCFRSQYYRMQPNVRQ